MKSLVVLFGFVAAIGTGWAQDTFSKQLTPEEYARAGLGKLSPREIAELDTLFRKYGRPEANVPAAVAPGAPAPPVQASAPTMPPNPVTPPAQSPAGVANGNNSAQGIIRLRKAPPPASKKEVVVISTEVDGTFTGWEETTVWTMKDGSIWRVDNRPRPYVSAKVSNPRVRITPALLNGYWIDFVDLGVRVRAIRLK